MFFVASAPLQAEGHINLSPRGLDSLRIIDDQHVVLLDLTGSGNETAAHLAQNGRLTIMLCAFEGDPKIVRLYGNGKVITQDDKKWSELRPSFPSDMPGVRQLFYVDVNRVQTSCGFGVPLMDYRGQRDKLLQWAQKKGPKGIAAYQEKNNRVSIDGLAAPHADQKNG